MSDAQMILPGTASETARSNGAPAWLEPGTAYIYALIAVSSLAIFFYDLMTPLGVSEWVFYCVPVALSFLLWHPAAPLVIAASLTAFSAVGFFLSPTGIDAALALQNRSFGVITYWILAATAFMFIRGKLVIRCQEWIQGAAVGLSHEIAGELSVKQVGESTLKFLSEYFNAKAAAIFVDMTSGFTRSATYAVPERADIPESIQPGDGLLGQAIKDNRAFAISRLPDGYLSFGSALGNAIPHSLLVTPVAADGEVNAVMEFGFTEAPAEQILSALNQLSQTIGVAIRSAKYRARLQELLEETRLQAEELQKQSEELRAANEELEQQAQALETSQARLEQQQSDLEQTNSLLMEQTQALEERRADVERISRYKSEFLANMSHELRTPLNSALIMARLLADNRDANLTAEQVKYAETIEAAGNDLLALINDILDLSKIEAGRVEVNVEPVPIRRIVDKLARGFSPLAQQKKLDFVTAVADDCPQSLETDPQRFEQILKNFLSNAIKFTEKGEVRLDIERKSDGLIAFTVKDSGIGIPPEHHDVIFEAFRQADGTTNRKYGGTGLGLSISKELARLLGGEITLISEDGKGSSFTLLLPETYDAERIPNRNAPAVPASKIRSKSLDGRKTAPVRPRHIEDDRERLTGDSRVILIVEDDVKFARILYDLAHEQGFQCLVADTADDGVMIARQFLPHAIVLDVGLPDHSGLSVLDRLKHNVHTRHIPVHVVSLHDYAHTALAWGAVGYILKPVKRDELVKALQGFEERLNRKMRHVLVVEDDERQLESVLALLRSADIETTSARTAADSLEALENATFDCMVLDLSLPDISGFDLLEQLAKDEERSFPPVIVYTGRELTADEELRLRRYSKSIIVKGAKSPERLLDEVTLFLHQVVSDLPADQQKMLAKAVNRDGLLDGKRILVVEDDVRNVFALTSVFEPQGAVVEVARNGREALEALDRLHQASSPADLVLMDIMMPEMDGLTAMREIRDRPHWRDLPIIALTAKAMANDQNECISAGANDYMAKPLDVEKLLSLVRVWMPR